MSAAQLKQACGHGSTAQVRWGCHANAYAMAEACRPGRRLKLAHVLAEFSCPNPVGGQSFLYSHLL